LGGIFVCFHSLLFPTYGKFHLLFNDTIFQAFQAPMHSQVKKRAHKCIHATNGILFKETLLVVGRVDSKAKLAISSNESMVGNKISTIIFKSVNQFF